MAMANTNLIGVLVPKLWPVQRVRVVVWLPGLRRDISCRWWKCAAGAIVRCSMTENMEHKEDTEEYLYQLVDKLHIKPEELRYILREILVEMGEEEFIRRDKLSCVEVLGKVCWRCGGRDHGGSKCEWRGRCDACEPQGCTVLVKCGFV